MSIFGAVVRTVVNVATLPAAVVKDVFTCGGVVIDERPATLRAIERIKREAETDFDPLIDELTRRRRD